MGWRASLSPQTVFRHSSFTYVHALVGSLWQDMRKTAWVCIQWTELMYISANVCYLEFIIILCFHTLTLKSLGFNPLRLSVRVVFSQGYTCTMWAARCTQSVWVTAVSLSRAATVISNMASTPPPCAKSPAAAASRSLTTSYSLSSSPSPWITALRWCTSSRRCAPSAWVLWRYWTFLSYQTLGLCDMII